MQREKLAFESIGARLDRQGLGTPVGPLAMTTRNTRLDFLLLWLGEGQCISRIVDQNVVYRLLRETPRPHTGHYLT